MNLHVLGGTPEKTLAQSLERFEEQFTYPLGPGRSFRISHGDDYPRFFRAMGEAACFVVEREGKVLGVVGVALRRLLLPSGEERPALYLGDLKIAPEVRSGRALLRLAHAVGQWVQARTQTAFGVVMDGTPVSPTRYTGRLGIPAFQELGKVMVLRVPTAEDLSHDRRWETEDARGSACYARLSAGRYACPGGFPAERSGIEPLWLMEPEGRACGRLEDTRRAKRLIADDGSEMHSAHLSCFAYEDWRLGVELLRSACGRAAGLGFPALFVAVCPADQEAFCEALQGTGVVVAPATVFGAGLAPGPLWNINTAEI